MTLANPTPWRHAQKVAEGQAFAGRLRRWQPGPWAQGPWPQRAAALVAGLLLTLAFAPHHLWPFALVSPAFLIWRWSTVAAAREGAWLGFAFGLGTFASGTWWLYISIHVLGQAPVWIALGVRLRWC